MLQEIIIPRLHQLTQLVYNLYIFTSNYKAVEKTDGYKCH